MVCRVVYIGTLRPCSTWRSGTPASVGAHSKVKLLPISNVTRSSRQYARTSVGSSTGTPFSHTR